MKNNAGRGWTGRGCREVTGLTAKTRGTRILLAAWISLIILSITYLLAARFSPDGHPTLFGTKLLAVLSSSMEPAFAAGDLVAVRPIGPTAARAGDIITFREDATGRLVTHRVIGFGYRDGAVAYKTKGDHNVNEDSRPVHPDQIIGRADFVVPYGGYAADFVRSPFGLILFVVLPGFWGVFRDLGLIAQVIGKSGADPSAGPKRPQQTAPGRHGQWSV